MRSVTITPDAMNVISRRCYNSTAITAARQTLIPLLAWAVRTYFDDASGRRTELGPQFYFSWTDAAEVKRNEYFVLQMAPVGKLALAPGELFQSGTHQIDVKDGKLTLESSA